VLICDSVEISETFGRWSPPETFQQVIDPAELLRSASTLQPARRVTPSLTDPSALARRVTFSADQLRDPSSLLSREWLVTNGLGGYASGTVVGVMTRRYHGLLIAALPAPLGRLVMVSQLGERLRLPNGDVHWLSGEERMGGALFLEGVNRLQEFRLEGGLPVWRFDVDGYVIEKRLLLPRFQNTVLVTYSLLEGDGAVRIGLRPLLGARPHEMAVDHPLPPSPTMQWRDGQLEVHLSSTVPPLRLQLHGSPGAFTLDTLTVKHLLYRVEQSRGYQSQGDAWSPGYFRADLLPGSSLTLIASTESVETMQTLTPEEARNAEVERRRRLLVAADPVLSDSPTAELILAADQFIIAPAGRVEDTARARAAGDDARTIIAGYHWFTDWGRDTMISLEGLTLVTGRPNEARDILRTFAHHFRDGLIPNMFPEGDKEGLYHTADATLWFFQALHRYDMLTGDHALVSQLMPSLDVSLDRHRQGTRFNIGVDPSDGLLRQGEEGYQLTWMDAKVDDWVVTPRRGKAVEINALWYNALRLAATWHDRSGHQGRAAELHAWADQTYASFNCRFWNDAAGCLFDVLDGPEGDDPACRPNQILAVGLTHPVLAPDRWPYVVDVVRDRLFTPVGLRSLDPAHPDFKATYDGDLRARDAAYHQGTVWAWLVGPFVDAWLRVHPGRAGEARAFLAGFVPHLSEACIGSISEIFDAVPPFTPRGCIAQAWSVAEVLRCWVLTASHQERRDAEREHAARVDQ
jgi:predicted glycogen debranching enzyme